MGYNFSGFKGQCVDFGRSAGACAECTMDEFSESLERDRLPEWSDEYLDYQSFQDKVEAAAASNQDEATAEHHKNDVQSEPGVCRSQCGYLEQRIISHCAAAAALDKEIKQILSFYSKQESAVQRNVHDFEISYARTQDSMSNSHPDNKSKRQTIQAHLQKLQTSGEHVSNLFRCLHVSALLLASWSTYAVHAH